MTNNFFQIWKVKGNEKQFNLMGPYRPTCGTTAEIRKARLRNINMVLAVILRNPNNWKQVWRNRYNLICDFALDGKSEKIFQRLGSKKNKAVIDLHHAIQKPNPKKGKSPISANKKYLLLPNDTFRRKIFAYDEKLLIEFMGICLISRNTHDQFKSYRYEIIDKDWYENNGIKLPSYWTDKNTFDSAIEEINAVFSTKYNSDTLWQKFQKSIQEPKEEVIEYLKGNPVNTSEAI